MIGTLSLGLFCLSGASFGVSAAELSTRPGTLSEMKVLGAFSAPVSSGRPGILAEVQDSLLISDNSAYDGATLPPPAKKKNQVTLSGDDTPDDTGPRKNRHKKQLDSDGATPDAMSGGDTANGASLPPVKKNPRGPEAGAARGGNVATERDGRPGPERKPARDQGGIFGKGPLDLTALSLTDEQKQKIAQMHAENGAKMRELMRKRRDLSMQMKDIMFDADVTDAQIRSKRDEVRQVQEKLEDLRLNDFLAIRSVLTAEQRQKLKDVKLANSRPRDGEAPPSQVAKRDGGEPKRLADTPNK